MSLDEDLGPLSWIVTIAFFALCAVSFAVRVYARGTIVRCFAWDDWFMTIAFLTLIGQQYICWKWLSLGAGKHARDVSSDDLEQMKLYQLIEEFYYFLVQLFLKLSFLLFFYRTLPTPRFRTAIRITIALVFIQTIATWIFSALQCRPLAAYFNPDDYPDAVCYPYGISYYAPSAVNVVINVLIYLLPLPTITHLSQTQAQPARPETPDPSTRSIPLPSRPTLAAPFLLGGLSLLVSGLRVVILYQLSTTTTAASTATAATTTTTASLTPTADYPYTLGLAALATTAELALAATTANLPAARTLHRHLRATSFHRRRDGGYDSDMELVEGGDGRGKITITSRVSISITEALRGGAGSRNGGGDGPPGYPRKYFRFARPGAQILGPNMSTAKANDASKDKDYGSETSSTHTEDNEKKPVMTETVSVQESGECSRPITTEQILAQRRREKIKANGGVEPEPKPKGAARKLVHIFRVPVAPVGTSINEQDDSWLRSSEDPPSSSNQDNDEYMHPYDREKKAKAKGKGSPDSDPKKSKRQKTKEGQEQRKSRGPSPVSSSEASLISGHSGDAKDRRPDAQVLQALGG
ncbi:l-fucose permease [Neofusicoccum parvum]|nr:l-fucose permease [Neofusicoccum parvum]